MEEILNVDDAKKGSILKGGVSLTALLAMLATVLGESAFLALQVVTSVREMEVFVPSVVRAGSEHQRSCACHLRVGGASLVCILVRELA